MKYSQYITKKRFKGQCLAGHVNIPYGTICSVEGEFIAYKGKFLCAITSQQAKDYFWGYDPINPEAEIKRQERAAELLALAPAEDGDSLSEEHNTWRNYGALVDAGMGFFRWQWHERVQDFATERLDYLLRCIKEGVRPNV